jgi:hypothetical protein
VTISQHLIEDLLTLHSYYYSVVHCSYLSGASGVLYRRARQSTCTVSTEHGPVDYLNVFMLVSVDG